MDKDEFTKIAKEHRKYMNDLSNIVSFKIFNEIIEKNVNLLDFQNIRYRKDTHIRGKPLKKYLKKKKDY